MVVPEPGLPASPCGPAGPAGPGVVTTVGGALITVGCLSHALKARAAQAAVNAADVNVGVIEIS